MHWLEMLLWGEVDIPNRIFYPLALLVAMLALVSWIYGDKQIQWWLKEVMKR